MTYGFERARDGDPSAKRTIVDALRPRIAKMAHHYARRCLEDPDDLLQEAWLGLLEALPALDTEIGSPEQYLISRARWRLLDAIKRAHVRRCISLDDELLSEFPVAAQLETAFSEASASEFIRSLSAVQRTILCCLLSGLTWRETGCALGCTSANVAYHVRCIRHLFNTWACSDL